MRLQARVLLIAAAAATLLATTLATAMTPSTADELRAQATAWDRDIVRRDRAGIEKNLHPKFFQIDKTGARHERAEFIEGLLDPKLQIDPYTVPDLEVHQFGTTALLTGTTRLSGHYDGKPFQTHYRYIDTYVRENGRWSIVAVQITAISPD